MSLMSLTAVELGKKIQAKEVTAVEAAREAFLQIERMDSKIHCMITVDKEEIGRATCIEREYQL